MPATGRFVWYELMAADHAAAGKFYGDVIGWTVADSGMTGHKYMILSMGETMVGGIMEQPDVLRDAGAPPAWIGYIGVPDVDAAANALVAAGGTLHRGPQDIPTIGRFAVVSDPHGAVFTLFTGADASATPMPVGDMPGRVGWHELRAGALEPDFAFYAAQFGWTKDHDFDMGPMGPYRIFAIDGVRSGGMMTRHDTGARPHWLFFFNVDDINAAAERAKTAGGGVVNGPMEVPGGQWIVQCTDPQGAQFAMLAPR